MVQLFQFQGTTRSREIFVGFGPPTGRQLSFSRGITSEKVEPCTEPRLLAPLVAAPGNQNESPLLVPALAALTDIAKAVGIELRGSIVSFDGRLRQQGQSQGDLQPRADPQHP